MGFIEFFCNFFDGFIRMFQPVFDVLYGSLIYQVQWSPAARLLNDL